MNNDVSALSRVFYVCFVLFCLTQEKLDHLRKKIAYHVVTMKGNKGDLPGFLYKEIID